MTVESVAQTAVRSDHTAEDGSVVVASVDRPVAVRLEVRPNDAEAACAAAGWIAQRLGRAAEARSSGPVTLAVSGGRTPATMLAALARQALPWKRLHVFQVDERWVPDADLRRNAHQTRAALGDLLGDRLHLVPIHEVETPEASAVLSSAMLNDVLGVDGRLDVVHLGLGDDGHTASLVPSDPSLAVTTPGYTVTDVYQGTRRVTMTYLTLGNACHVCWLAPGSSKAPMISRLLVADPTIPAGSLAIVPGAVFTDIAGATP